MKKTVVIVGTGPGLGNHIAEKFGSMDFRVILLARHEAVLKQYQKELTSQGNRSLLLCGGCIGFQ